MTSLRRVLSHGSLYSLFQALGVAVSLVSFPILTRLLTVEEYGHLALFYATLSILLSVAKCGIPTSFVRSYAAVSREPRNVQSELYTNALGAALGITALADIAFGGALFTVGSYFERQLAYVLVLVIVFIPVQALSDLLSAFLRAEQRVIALGLYGFVLRAGSVATGVVCAIALQPGLIGYLFGALVFQFTGVLLVMLWFVGRDLFHPSRMSLPGVRGLVLFGAPLLLFELSSLMNDYADRFLINHFLGPAQVGTYSVGYNLATYVQGLVTAPLWMAIFPMYTKMWETEGPQATSQFLRNLLEYYVRGAVLLVVIVSLVSRELIELLATAKYASAAEITPYVIVSVLIYGSTHITAAGFYLVRDTKTVALLTVAGAALNIVANLLLIPSYGILGAAYATLFSYLALTLAISIRANRLVPVPWPIRVTVTSILVGLVAFLAARIAVPANLLAALASKSVVATIVYAGFLTLADRSLRQAILASAAELLRRVRSR